MTFPMTFQFSGKTYFYTIHPRVVVDAEHLEVLRNLEVLEHGLLRVLAAVLLVERRYL